MKKPLLFTLFALVTAALTARSDTADAITYTLPNNHTIQRFLPESDHTGWAVQVGGQLLYFADGTFNSLSGKPPAGQNFYETIMGDASRGFYQQRYIYTENSHHIKLLYRLIDGRAQLHCRPVQVTNAIDYVNGCHTYIARQGRVIYWNDNNFLLWRSDKWHSLAINHSHSKTPPLFHEQSGFIVIFMERMFYILNPDGALREFTIEKDMRIESCDAWGAHTMIARDANDSALVAFDIRTGAEKPIPNEFNGISESIREMRASPNNIIWCFTDKFIYRLAPDCTTSKFEKPGCDAMKIVAISDTKDLSKSLKDDPEWDIFYLNESSELRGLNSKLVIDYASSMNLIRQPRNVIANANRKVWILTGIAKNRLIDIDLKGRRKQSRLNQTDLWQIYKMRQQTPLLGHNGHIAFFSDTENALLRWNGSEFTTTRLPEIFKHPISDTAIDSRGVIYCIVFISEGFNNQRLYEISHNSVKLLSDDRTYRFFHTMEMAIARSVSEGATSFSWRDRDVLITSDSKAWVRKPNSNVFKYLSGGVWKFVRLAKTPDKIIETERRKIAIHIQNEGWLAFNNGIFNEKISLPAFKPKVDEKITQYLTPMKNRFISARHSDKKGGVWLWLRDENRVALCQTGLVKIMLIKSQPSATLDNIMIEAATSYALDGVRYAYRIAATDAWTPFNTPASNRARVFFPESGAYNCEVAAFYMDERIPDTAEFTFVAEITNPETILAEGIDSKTPLLIKNTLWYPPVTASSSSYVREQACETIWRISGLKAWNKLEEDGAFPLYKLLTNGVHAVEFATEEAGFLRDRSPLTLHLKLSLDETDLLRLTLKNLFSADETDKTTAQAILKSNRSRWRQLLPLIGSDAREAKERLSLLRPIERYLPYALEAR